MKHARVAFDGAIHWATPGPGADGLVLADGRRLEPAAMTWLPPIDRGTTIIALGLNYADHSAELGFKAPEEPLIFLKGFNALIGHDGSSVCPADARQMHPECELAVVIGHVARRVPRAEAMAHVGGYTIANDYAVRDYLENYYRPNLRAKNRDGLTPLGPWLVDAQDLGDPQSLRLTTRVNGRVVQQGSTRDMVFDIPLLIEFLSAFMTLMPGDVILTGTPHGVAFVKPGDEVETEIEGIGILRNRVCSDAVARRERS